MGDHAALQVVLPQQTSHIMEQGCGTSMDTATVAMDLSANDAFPSWENDPVQHLSPRHTQGFLCSVVVSSISNQFLARRYLLITDATGSGATNNYSSSIGSQSGTWPTSEATEQDIMLPALRGELLFQLCPCKCFADTNFLTLLWLSWTHFNMLFVQIVFYSSPLIR